MALTLTINGATRIVDAPADMPLLWVLRDVIKLKGTKYGCGIAACGACTVLVDGEPVRSCVTLAGDVTGAVTTIEGLAEDGVLSAVQQAWVELNVAQCGYCQSGQIMAATALLAGKPDPDDAEVTEAMDGNLCRCGTYPKIRAAIARASALLKDAA
ncbi:MAG: (2Fe-2S)-binding protein [Rhizobiaceae bacterium]|jgi:isoquinoline 1-oxidoreductase alpha subunit|nr:(2Fe-2S)-binding protein [Rhizobiaceae bacterium]